MAGSAGGHPGLVDHFFHIIAGRPDQEQIMENGVIVIEAAFQIETVVYREVDLEFVACSTVWIGTFCEFADPRYAVLGNNPGGPVKKLAKLIFGNGYGRL